MASIKLKGDTSGEITISAPAVAGTTTLELPATSSTLATQNALGVRNLIINGDMRIAQRGASVTGITASGYASLDRWYVLEGTDGTYTMSQDTDVPSGQGFSNSLKMAVTTADTSLTGTQSLRLWQKIEGQNLQHLKFGTSSAESFTLSFWIKSKTTGDFVVRILNVDANRHICKLVSIDSADTWEKKTLTFVGDTTGSIDNDNGDSFRVDIWFSAGPDVSSGTLPTTWATNNTADSGAGQTIDLASSTSNYINITGVQLEVGDTATPFEHRPYDMELARCQRYFRKFGPEANSWNGTMTSASYARFYMPLAPSMRTAPAMSYSGSFTQCVEMVGYAFLSPTSVFTANGSPYHFAINASGMSGGASERLVQIRTNILGVTLDSEL